MRQLSALLFLFLLGCSTAQDPVTGPEEVRGQEQGSLTVQCRYTSGWKDYQKYWCRGDYWKTCEILVETDASEQMVKRNRVSIRDDQTDFIFTVTMEALRMSDADMYWCGITKAGNDHMFKVNVNIDPAPKTSTTIMTTTTATALTSTAPTSIAPTSTEPTSTERTSTARTSTPPTVKNVRMKDIDMNNNGKEHVIQDSLFFWFLLSTISFQAMVFVVVPLLLSMLIAVLWVNGRRRRYGGGEIALVKIQSSDVRESEN